MTPGVLGFGRTVSTDGQTLSGGRPDAPGWPGRRPAGGRSRGLQPGGRTGDDTLVSTGGDDTLVGGSGHEVFQINPGKDPTGDRFDRRENTLDFSIACRQSRSISPRNRDQRQTVDSAGDHWSLIGAFDTYIASSHGDSMAPTPITTFLWLPATRHYRWFGTRLDRRWIGQRRYLRIARATRRSRGLGQRLDHRRLGQRHYLSVARGTRRSRGIGQ